MNSIGLSLVSKVDNNSSRLRGTRSDKAKSSLQDTLVYDFVLKSFRIKTGFTLIYDYQLDIVCLAYEDNNYFQPFDSSNT